MNLKTYEQLESIYEETLEAMSELTDTLSEMQDSFIDSLADIHGDLQSLICTLRGCQKSLHQAAENVQ